MSTLMDTPTASNWRSGGKIDTISNKKGQARVIEAMIACLLLVTGLSVATRLSRQDLSVKSSDLEEAKENIFSVLSTPEVTKKFIDSGGYSDAQLRTLLETLMPPSTEYIISLRSALTGENIWNASSTNLDSSSGYDIASGTRTVTISLSAYKYEYTEIDVMLVIDRSGSMGEEDDSGQIKIDQAKNAAKLFVDQLNMSRDRVGLASFSTEATLDCHLMNNSAQVKSKIDSLNANGYTNIGGGINRSNEEFLGYGRDNSMWVMILLSDGVANYYYDEQGHAHYDETLAKQYALDQANIAKNLRDKGVRIYTIGLGSAQNFDEDLLKQIASEEFRYYNAPTAAQLNQIYLAIARDIQYKVKCDIVVIQLTLIRSG